MPPLHHRWWGGEITNREQVKQDEADHSLTNLLPTPLRDTSKNASLLSYSPSDRASHQRPSWVEEVQTLVWKDRLPEALRHLREIEALRNEALQLSWRLENVRKDERRGTITPTDARTEYARIVEALLDLIST